MQKVQKIYIIYDELYKPCMVAHSWATAISYGKWFLRTNFKVESVVLDVNKLNIEEITDLLKEM